MDIQNKIDWKFIGQLEGDSIYGSVPTENSGVTIGMGFDLKEKDTNFLSVKMGLSDSLVEKLSPYIGMSGTNAKKFLEDNPLILTDQERMLINERSKAKYTADIINQYETKTGRVFSELSGKQQTIIASIGYQYGNFDRTPTFLKHLKNNDWNGVTSELLNFKDDFTTRRHTEEHYLNNLKGYIVVARLDFPLRVAFCYSHRQKKAVKQPQKTDIISVTCRTLRRLWVLFVFARLRACLFFWFCVSLSKVPI